MISKRNMSTLSGFFIHFIFIDLLHFNFEVYFFTDGKIETYVRPLYMRVHRARMYGMYVKMSVWKIIDNDFSHLKKYKHLKYRRE